MKLSISLQNEGRRSGIDRRIFSYAIHLPERKSGKDRRSGIDRRKGTERRKHNRFKVKEGAFAMIMSAPAKLERITDMSMGEIALAVLKARPVQMGRIVNIGKGGLTFCYIDDKEQSNELLELDILFARDAFYLKNVPFRTVSDFITVSTFSSGTFEMKQKGVQFGELMPNQLSELDFFIRNHTTGKA